MPGEQFSMYNTVSPFTEDNGYADAGQLPFLGKNIFYLFYSLINLNSCSNFTGIYNKFSTKAGSYATTLDEIGVSVSVENAVDTAFNYGRFLKLYILS